jgi:hypothetical protein
MHPARLNGSFIALLGALFATLPAVAHHGWSGQSSEQTEISGKVHKAVSLSGPHATMQIISGGQVWDVTLSPPARTESAGLKEKTLAVGDAVTVRGHRNTDPKRFEIKTVRVTAAGRNYDVDPARIK